MIKPAIIKSQIKSSVVFMSNMSPLQVGRVISEGSYKGTIVMRTASSENFEVMILSDPKTDNCWLHKHNLLVELFPSGTKIEIEVA